MRFGRLIITKYTGGVRLGIYAVNWGEPIGHQWEIGIDFFVWSIGLELYK